MDIALSKPKSFKRTVRNYKNVNVNGLIAALLNVNEPIPECAKHHGSLVTQQNFSTWRLYFSNEGRC